jgi:hypothetical protein
MKTLESFADVPPSAVFLGASWRDGFIDESLKEQIEMALNPARITDGSTTWFWELIEV